jgi:hypothetical protein
MKRKTITRAIAHEEAREAIKDGHYEVAGAVRLDPTEVSRLMVDHEGSKYFLISDLFQLLGRGEFQIAEKTKSLDSAYVSVVPFELALNLLIALLRIPTSQAPLAPTGGEARQTEEETAKLRENTRAASRIAQTVQIALKKDGSPPSLEQVDKLIHDQGDPAFVRGILEAARAGDSLVTLNNNEELPQVPSMPKALLSERKHRVLIAVDGVQTSTSTATVKIVRSLDDGVLSPALDGIVGVNVPAKFTDRKGKLKRPLMGSQWTGQSIEALVEVTRGFRSRDDKYNNLTLCRLKGTRDLVAAVENEATQLKLDLDV